MEWFKDELDLVFAGTSLSMIVVSVVCALVRWFHVCAPYQHNPSYYYPARPMVTMFFLSQLLYIPVVLHPSDPVVCASAPLTPYDGLRAVDTHPLLQGFDLEEKWGDYIGGSHSGGHGCYSRNYCHLWRWDVYSVGKQDVYGSGWIGMFCAKLPDAEVYDMAYASGGALSDG